VIDTLKVVVAASVLEFPFEIEVDLNGGQVFTKPLNGETLKYLPENYSADGWVEAKFID
jgi:hypothetical protein